MAALLLWVVLANGLVAVPASQWKPVDVTVTRPNSHIECSYSVQEGGSSVQVSFMEKAQASRFRQGRRFIPVQAMKYGREGRFRTYVEKAGEYVLLIDNRLEARRPAYVNVRLDATPPVDVLVRTLDPERKRAVIAISLLTFGAIVTGSAALFLRQTRI